METIAVFMSYASILRVPSSPTNTIAGVLLSRTRDCRAALLEEELLHHFELMSSRLTGYASSFDLSRQDAEDVVQEVFLALFRHLQQDRPRDNLRAWLYQVAHNLALKRRLRNVAEPKPSANASSVIVRRCCRCPRHRMKPARRSRRESVRWRWCVIAATTTRCPRGMDISRCWWVATSTR